MCRGRTLQPVNGLVGLEFYGPTANIVQSQVYSGRFAEARHGRA